MISQRAFLENGYLSMTEEELERDITLISGQIDFLSCGKLLKKALPVLVCFQVPLFSCFDTCFVKCFFFSEKKGTQLCFCCLFVSCFGPDALVSRHSFLIKPFYSEAAALLLTCY